MVLHQVHDAPATVDRRSEVGPVVLHLADGHQQRCRDVEFRCGGTEHALDAGDARVRPADELRQTRGFGVKLGRLVVAEEADHVGHVALQHFVALVVDPGLDGGGIEAGQVRPALRFALLGDGTRGQQGRDQQDGDEKFLHCVSPEVRSIRRGSGFGGSGEIGKIWGKTLQVF